MYVAVLILLLAASGWLLFQGARHRRRGRWIGGAVLAGATVLLFSIMDLWGEVLWFHSLGYGDRIWTEILAKALLGVGGLLLGGGAAYLLTLSLKNRRRSVRVGTVLVGASIGLSWGLSHWETVLRYLERVPAGVREPILGRDAGFYLFTLPFYDAIYTLVALLAFAALLGNAVGLFIRVRDETLDIAKPVEAEDPRSHPYRTLYASAGLFLLALAFDKFLARYHLLYSKWGAVAGPGWTDVHVRLPAYAIIAALTLVAGLAVLLPPVRDRLQTLVTRVGHMRQAPSHAAAPLLGVIGVGTLVLWFVALTIVPSLIQWLRVEPNEITLERPYIAHNIAFTRKAFGLDAVEEQEFPAVSAFSRETVEEYPAIFRNIRLWDWRALDAVYKQFQEIRLYYEFADVDIDRYDIASQYRQVMVSAREMELANLPEQSQTFVNRRFKYTHGYGLTLAPVHEFTEEGLPNLLIKDIPPVSRLPELEVKRPEIYYGELTRTHVVVNSAETEFDYPSGEENIYARYEGDGGVPISSFWRKVLFGWKFDGTRFLLSGYPRSESRIQFHRQIRQRVNKLAPFLQFDADPYIVLVDGRLYWILDAYTTSSYYPYSEPFSASEFIEYRNSAGTRSLQTSTGRHLRGINYMRNAVKAVVDAYQGTVDLYVFEPQDPLIRVWERIFPGLFKQESEMPGELRTHVRYPVDLLRVQGLVYAKYHMTDPTVFYNQEDLWIRATEKYHGAVQPVEPYYVIWELPDVDKPDFVLMLPFTPKNRQVLIGWIAGMCDGEDYGRLLAYKFPKERRVIGPQQVETKIDQDPHLSGQLTLWDQRGSNVIRGNVLAIPIGETLVYVEPIYLQADTAAYPELRLVVIMHGDNMSYAESFDEALAGLLGDEADVAARAPGPAAAPATQVARIARQASQAFDNYLAAVGDGEFDRAAGALETLQRSLERLVPDTTAATAR